MIEFKDVSFQYNGNKEKALDHVSFRVEEGQWVSIIGHNGSGKSTIAKLMIGLLEATEGEIWFLNTKLEEKTVDLIRRKIGIVFQNPDNQFVGYNVKYDIAFGLENRMVPREEMIQRIYEYTEKVDMRNELDREPQTLSGGQKQRLTIARALLSPAKVFIFDEVTSGLDTITEKRVVDNLMKLKDKTIIFIAHRLAIAERADKVVVIDQGQIVEEGSHEELMQQHGFYYDLVKG